MGRKEREERREARKQQREEEQESRQRKQTITRSVKVAAIILLVLAGAYLLLRRPDTSGKGLLGLGTTTYSFGEVSVSSEKVKGEIALRNTGEGILTITKLESSCGCTSASLTFNGEEGPVFSMPGHGPAPPQGWSAAILPGQAATLNVYYNPRTHPELRGPVERVVTVRSDDPRRPMQQVRVMVTQVD